MTKVFSSLLILSVLSTPHAEASIAACRTVVESIRAEVSMVSQRTLGAVEALRSVDLPKEALRAQLVANIMKDSHLGEKLSKKDAGHLADELMAARWNLRTVSHVIGRFVYRKDHAVEIALAQKDGQKAGQKPASKPQQPIRQLDPDDLMQVPVTTMPIPPPLTKEELDAIKRRGPLGPIPPIGATIPEGPLMRPAVIARAQPTREPISLIAKDYLAREWGHFSEADRFGIEIFMHNAVFVDPAFQQAPAQYLQDWQAKRGGFENLMIPEDPAMNFLEELDRKGTLEAFARNLIAENPQATHPEIKPLSTRWTKDISEADAILAKFMARRWSHMDTIMLTDFVREHVLVDPAFLSDPLRYLKTWNEKRGGLEVLMIPEDPALEFLKDLYQTGQLDNIATIVRNSKRVAKDPSKVMSAIWAKQGQAAIIARVNEYLEKDWSHFGPREHEMIRAYLLKTVFTDAKFKEDPVAYVTEIQSERGGLQMLSIPRDPAMKFLTTFHRASALYAFAKKVEKAGF